jgi:hypothetical protein
MSIDIYKILYCSKNLIEGEQAQRNAGISQIFQKARRNNKEAHRNSRATFQVRTPRTGTELEGPRPEDDLSSREQWIDPCR